ncbi:MAG: hypothetical protein F6K24_44620, partial [Okeania sp. SIO2D1]|nr:hypothetical protein [Okeania sp. SIO2D1]
ENGTCERLGYYNSGDLRASYPNFFRKIVYPYIQAALCHLAVTRQGRQVIASLYQNLLTVEEELGENQGSSLTERLAQLPAIPNFPNLSSVFVPSYHSQDVSENNRVRDLFDYDDQNICRA